MPGRVNYWLILALINIVFALQLKAKPEEEEDNFIKLSGLVNCTDPINGRLALVSVLNISRGWGTSTGINGEFEIEMGISDTIIFYTPAHKDFYYILKENEQFKNHFIQVYMETDAIWLETVNIIGLSNLEDFKLKVLNMEIYEQDISLGNPKISKYSKELATGDIAPVIIGPLTYLYQKFNKQQKLNRKIKSNSRR